jgi:hypothetical protein
LSTLRTMHMLRRVVGVLVVTACGAPAPPPPLAPASPTVVSPSRTATAASTSTPNPKRMTEVVTILYKQQATVLGLEIKVLDTIVKRDMDGRDFMRVLLHVRAGDKQDEIQLSTGVPRATWNAYVIEFHGGSNNDVMLGVTTTP